MYAYMHEYILCIFCATTTSYSLFVVQELLEDLGKSLRWLRPAQRVFAVHDEQRNAGAAPLAPILAALLLDLGLSDRFVVEQPLGGFGRHARAVGACLEDAA